MNDHTTPLLSTQTGLSLIEVLVAIVVISFGLLGVAAIQITGLKNNHSAYYRAIATNLAYDMVDRMRANRKELIAGNYNSGSFKGIADAPEITDSSSMSTKDKADWLTLLGKQLPSGKGKIEAGAAASSVRVTIQWNDARGTQGNSTQELSIETQGCPGSETCYF